MKSWSESGVIIRRAEDKQENKRESRQENRTENRPEDKKECREILWMRYEREQAAPE